VRLCLPVVECSVRKQNSYSNIKLLQSPHSFDRAAPASLLNKISPTINNLHKKTPPSFSHILKPTQAILTNKAPRTSTGCSQGSFIMSMSQSQFQPSHGELDEGSAPAHSKNSGNERTKAAIMSSVDQDIPVQSLRDLLATPKKTSRQQILPLPVRRRGVQDPNMVANTARPADRHRCI
jgi:hypothetical protein